MLPTAGSVQAGPTLPMAGSVTSAWQHQGRGCKGGGFAFPLGMLWVGGVGCTSPGVTYCRVKWAEAGLGGTGTRGTVECAGAAAHACPCSRPSPCSGLRVLGPSCPKGCVNFNISAE